MNSRRLIITVVFYVVLVALQLLVARNLALFDTAFCFAYVGAILLLPLQADSVIVMLVACGTGLLTDAFYETPGLHGAASTLLAFLRPLLLRVMVPPGGYEDYMEPSASSMGARWYFMYMVPLIFIHHAALFVLEHLHWFYVPMALLKAACSTLLTLAVIMMVQFGVAGRTAPR